MYVPLLMSILRADEIHALVGLDATNIHTVVFFISPSLLPT